MLPPGYSFNLDGSTLYLSLASVFVAQLAGVQMTLGQQLVMMLTLMLTSKGVAGVPRASLVVLAGDADAVRPAARGRGHSARHRPDHGHGPHGRERHGQLHRHGRRRALGRRAGRRAMRTFAVGADQGRLMRIAVVGARGQLGAAVVHECAPGTRSWRSRTPSSTSPTTRRSTAAMAARAARRDRQLRGVQRRRRAEDRPVEALNINAFAVRALARAAAAHGAALVHYSTDFVFDGTATAAVHETDRPNPQSVYAASKLLGEWFAADAPRAYVLRVESLFGSAQGGGPAEGSVASILKRLRAGGDARGVRGPDDFADLRVRRRARDAAAARDRRRRRASTTA